MNSRIFTRWTGTPTLRAALASPPTAKIQLPKRVRASIQVASAVIAIHQITLMRKLCGAQNVLAKTIVAALWNARHLVQPGDAHRAGDHLGDARG